MFLEDHKAPRNLPVHLNNTIQDFKMALCTKKMHVSIDNVCHLEKVKCNLDVLYLFSSQARNFKQLGLKKYTKLISNQVHQYDVR